MKGGFKGFPDDFQAFYIGLKMDNSRSYFEANRKVYAEKVRGPMEALVATLEPEFGIWKIFRPHRDIRFSKDKSPYKTSIGAHVGSGSNGGYLALDSEGLTVGGGRYELEAPLIPRFRDAVAAEASGRQLAEIVETLGKAGFEVGGEELKKVPPGYLPDHPRARLLRHKRLFAWKHFGLQPWLGSAAAADRVAQALRAIAPLTAWLDKHVGASTSPTR